MHGRPFPTARTCTDRPWHCGATWSQCLRVLSASGDAEEAAGEGDFALEEGVGELFFAVGVVVVGGVEDGVAAEMLERVHGQEEVAQHGLVLQQRQTLGF